MLLVCLNVIGSYLYCVIVVIDALYQRGNNIAEEKHKLWNLAVFFESWYWHENRLTFPYSNSYEWMLKSVHFDHFNWFCVFLQITKSITSISYPCTIPIFLQRSSSYLFVLCPIISARIAPPPWGPGGLVENVSSVSPAFLWLVGCFWGLTSI